MLHPAEDQTEAANVEELYGAFMGCEVSSTVFVDEGFLRTMGLYEEVERRFEAAGWKGFMKFESHTDVEDVCEFLASVRMMEDSMGIRYRHRGIYYEVLGTTIRRAFGWDILREEEVDDHTNHEAWAAMTGGKRYVSGRSNGSEIIEPVFFYLQRLVSHSIIGRHNGSQKPGVLDMDVLRGLYYEKKVAWVSAMSTHWTRIKPVGPILVGGIITHMLRAIHDTEEAEEHDILDADFLTVEKMKKMKGVAREPSGEIVWKYRRETHARLRGRIGASAQRGAIVRREDTVVVDRRWAFNVARVMEFAAPDGADLNLEPPPEWQPGHPIPSGYRMREEATDDSFEYSD